MRKMKAGVALGAALISQSLYFDAANAQEKADGNGPLLEEIIVTADRKNSFGADYVQAGTFRGARMMDTPLTVNIMPRDLLDAQQVTSMGDAVRNTAGVTYSQVSPAVYANLAIRGIPVENRSNYRMNGSLPIVNQIDLPMEDKERMEVLKGVASLYYGFTTPAGIVNLTMKRPTAEALNEITLSGNQFGGVGVHADMSRRFGEEDEFGLRVNAVQGWLETGVDAVDGHRTVGAVAFDWDPVENVKIRLDAEYIEKKITETATITLPAAVNGVTILPPMWDPKKSLSSQWMYSDANELNLMAHVEWRFAENWSITGQAGRSDLSRDRHYNTFRNYNLTTGAGTLQVLLSNGNDYVNENYRTELAGAFETGPLTHQLSVGGTINTRTAETPSNPTVNYAQNYYNPVRVAETPLPARVVPNPSKITDQGAYIFDRISYESWIDVLVGARYTDYQNKSKTGTPYNTTKTSPSYGLVVKPQDWISLYATYIEGLEEGGVAPLTAANGGEVLPPAISKQKEAGVKVEPQKGLMVSVTYFDIDRASSFLNSANRFVQDGRTLYKGWEASATGEVTQRLSIFATAMYLDAAQQKAASTAVIGKRPENTAKYTASLFAEYKPEAVEGLGVSAGLFYVGNRAINNQNTAFIDGYTTYNAGIRYSTDIADHPVTFRLNGENLTGKKYWAATGANLLSPALPMTVKFAVTSRF